MQNKLIYKLWIYDYVLLFLRIVLVFRTNCVYDQNNQIGVTIVTVVTSSAKFP